MKTKFLSLVVAVAVGITELSSVCWAKQTVIASGAKQSSLKSEQLAYGVFITPKRRNYEPQAPEKIDQLAYIILGGPRRR